MKMLLKTTTITMFIGLAILMVDHDGFTHEVESHVHVTVSAYASKYGTEDDGSKTIYSYSTSAYASISTPSNKVYLKISKINIATI